MAPKPKDYDETFELNGEQIKTIVTSDTKEIEKQISSFLRPSNNNQTKVIGFDVEWFLLYSDEVEIFSKSVCANLQLCDGNSCLIIQLNQFLKFHSSGPVTESVYQSLLSFLRHPNITFVGIGIKDDLAKLEKCYGFGIRNAVELVPLAATAMGMPRLSYCGVDELAFVANRLDLNEHRNFTMPQYNYSNPYSPLPKELAEFATVNVYSYYKIGTTLIQPNHGPSLAVGVFSCMFGNVGALLCCCILLVFFVIIWGNKLVPSHA